MPAGPRNQGTTTSLFEAVNNVPPEGIAAASSPTNKYIKHAGTGAITDDYEAALQSYSTGGVTAGSTVSFVQPRATVGEEISTGTKLLQLQVLSNPTGTKLCQPGCTADDRRPGGVPDRLDQYRGRVGLRTLGDVGDAPDAPYPPAGDGIARGVGGPGGPVRRV